MPPFFDGAQLGDPESQSALGWLSGMASGFGKAAMPSALPVPMGAALGMAAEGANAGRVSGAQQAQTFKKGQLETGSAAVGLDQALIVENMLRKALGKPELTMQDLQGGKGGVASPLFGNATTSPMSVQAPAGGATAPQGDSAHGGDRTGMAGALVNKMLGFQPTEYQRAKLAADMMPTGPAKVEAERAAAKLAGIDVTANLRSGESANLYNPETGKYEEQMRNPNLSPDMSFDPATGRASLVPGALEGLGALETVRRGAAAQFEPLNIYDPAGNESIVPRTALQTGIPGQAPASQSPTYAARVAQLEGGGAANPPSNGASSAAGPDQFLNGTWLEQAKKYLPPEITKGQSDEQILALRTNPQVSGFLTNAYAQDNAQQLQKAGIKNVGAGELYLAHHFGADGAAAILKAPVNTPLAQLLPPNVLKANPDLQGMTVADVYSHASQAMKGVEVGAPSAAASAKPAPGSPKTPVQDSASDIPTKLDDFLGQLGPQYQPPARPAVVPGALMGEPGKGTEEIQKLDGDRLEQYSKEAAGGQKVYTNLQQLYQIMGRGLSTGNMTQAATNVTNYARQLGLSSLIPKGFDPNDAGAFNKLATDLVFAQLKQIGGRPMVSEIEGLKQANPNTSLTPAANVEILNNILADQRWRDSRADLGRQYMARFGSLGDFDARFNEKYPQVDTFNKITDAAAKSGWKLPGDANTPSGRGAAPASKPLPSVQKSITPENISHSAQVNHMTEDQVKALLRAKGYTVP